MCFTLKVLISLLLYMPALRATEIKIVFWLESSQISLRKYILQSITDIKDIRPDIQLQPVMFTVGREETNENTNINQFCQVLSTEGVSVIFDFTYYPWDEGMDYVRNFHIPYFAFARTLVPFFDMFADFMAEKNGDDVAFILQDAEDMNSALFHMILGLEFKVFLVLADDINFEEKLSKIRPCPTYYALFANSNKMNQIFEKIKKGNLFVRPPEWHLIFLDGQHESFKYRDEVENVTKFTFNTSEICANLKMAQDVCLKEFKLEHIIILTAFEILIEMTETYADLLKPNYIKCTNNLMPEDSTAIDLKSFLTTHNFLRIYNTNTGHVFGYNELISYNLNVSISIYDRNNSDELILAKWKSGEFLKLNETISPAKRFLRIGVAQSTPWNYYKRNQNTGEVEYDKNGKPIWEGFCIDLIKVLSKKMNFIYELVEPEIGKFGERDPETNQWDGIVGDLVSGQTDISVTALKMYSEREEVIDFIAPYFEQTGISIVIRKPFQETSLFKFMTVLRFEVWISVLGALVATAVMLWFLDKYSPYSARNNKEAYPYPCRSFTLRESFWFALTSFTPQGGGEAPKSVSGRILVAAYWLFVVLMLATFTANLAAFLTVERMNTPVQSLEQLGRQSRINYTVVADSDTHQYFINMKFAEDTLYRLWKELVLNESKDFSKFRVWDYPIKEQYGTILLAINGSGPVKTAAEGFQKVNENDEADFAFIHDSSEIKYEITRNCNLTEVGEVFAEQPYALAVQQGSHLSDELSYALLEMQTDRYFEELKAKFWNRSLLKGCSSENGSSGISLESLGGVFIATFFGLFLAILTLALEVGFYKRKQKKQIRNIIEVKEKKISQFKNNVKYGLKTKITPPPPFVVDNFKDQQSSNVVTLGGREFKPHRVKSRFILIDHYQLPAYTNEGRTTKDEELSAYIE